MAVRPTLVIEDCSALGQISLVAATTVLQAAGLTTALLPSVLLSTQTEGFGKPISLQTDNWVKPSYEHWRANGVHFSGGIIGYLGNDASVHKVSCLLKSESLSLLVVDPVMADRGHLYPGLTANYPLAMAELCKYADVITPNWTELCLLAGLNTVEPREEYFQIAIQQLRKKGISASVVVTGVVKGNQIGYWVIEGNEVKFIAFNYFPGHFFGTGDLFTALLYVYLQREDNLELAVSAAGHALAIAVEETSHVDQSDRRYGMKLQRLLAYLAGGKMDEKAGNN